MTKRAPVSSIQNVWFDAQQVDNTDLTLEQQHNDVIQSSTINNHIGTGVLPEVLVQNILFDSLLATGFLDGVNVQPQNQPADNNFGNQLEIELVESKATIKKSIKIAVIGLDFQNNLQYETFYFKKNEIQVSHKHFTKILVLLFNDFVGNPNLSLNLGGRIVIKEARPMTLSRSPIMVSQDVEPNLFFRDFFIDGSGTLLTLLQSALPFYNVDTLGVSTSEKDNKALLVNDVTTQIGQKFQATTNNIQKATLLLSVRNQEVGSEDDLNWNGELVVSIYPLQSNIECPSDIAPNLEIDFAPFNVPLVQTSISYSSLLAEGIVLDSVPQPVDFIFSSGTIANGNAIIPDNYYAITIKRSGGANKCDILIATGGDRVNNSRVTIFSGNIWVDIPEEDLWFKIWTDAAKVSDGQAYDAGHGIVLEKTTQDDTTLATVDFSLENLQFVGSDVYKAVVQADTEESVPIPDQKTGNPVLSRQQFVPKIQLLNLTNVASLEATSEPLVVGAIADKNRKFFDAVSSIINSKLYSSTIVKDQLIIKPIEDPTDTVRYDSVVSGLTTNLLLGDFVGAKIFPNSTNPSVYYRVADARLCPMVIGDVNGDGVIDRYDLDLLNTYINFNLNIGLPADGYVFDGYIPDGTGSDVADGYDGYVLYTNGYKTYLNPFMNVSNASFRLINSNNSIVESGSDGILVAHPTDPRLAQFTSASVNFSSVINLNAHKLVLTNSSIPDNYGGFDIVSVDTSNDVITIRKIILNGETISQMLRADIDGDFVITNNDGYYLHSYIERFEIDDPLVLPNPGPTTNPYDKIGKIFNVLKFTLEKFVDRTDDYSPVITGRSTTIHPAPDAFLADGYFASHNFYSQPVPISFQKQLTWDESLIVTNSKSKLVPSVFTQNTGFISPRCQEPLECNVYPAKPDFDPGKVDFFVPNDLILGEGGELKRPDGVFYKVDFEVGTITLEIPAGIFTTEKTINLMDDFVVDYASTSGNQPKGTTRLGFPAMRFADCTPVTADALAKNQIRFSVSVQSFSPNTNGLSDDGYEGVIVDGKMGVAIDYNTGFLTLNFTNLFRDEILPTLTTKVQVSVFLKKAGFNNAPIFIDAKKMQNLLNL